MLDSLPLGAGLPPLKLLLTINIGPLNGVFFLFAKTRPGEESAPKLADSLYWVEIGGGAARTMRMFEGKVEVVGVAGRTLTDECGDRAGFVATAEECMEFEAEEVEEAFEWVCT